MNIRIENLIILIAFLVFVAVLLPGVFVWMCFLVYTTVIVAVKFFSNEIISGIAKFFLFP
jgi:hypothetical protein